MPGLDPGIHHLRKNVFSKKMDHWVKPGDDDLDWYDGHCDEGSDEANPVLVIPGDANGSALGAAR